MKYHWQQADWPHFRYSTEEVEDLLFDYSQRAGKINGILEGLPEETKSEAILELLISEAIKIDRTHSLKEAKNSGLLGCRNTHVSKPNLKN